MNEDKIRIPLEDDIWGIEGDWTGELDRATGRDSDETLFFVEYVPNIDPNKSLVAWLRTVVPLVDPPKKMTPEPVPESQINKVGPNHAGSVVGVPTLKLHLKEKSDGSSDWRDRIGNKLETEERKLKRQQSRKESDELSEKAKRLRAEQDKNVEEDKRKRRTGEDYLTEEERVMQ